MHISLVPLDRGSNILHTDNSLAETSGKALLTCSQQRLFCISVSLKSHYFTKQSPLPVPVLVFLHLDTPSPSWLTEAVWDSGESIFWCVCSDHTKVFYNTLLQFTVCNSCMAHLTLSMESFTLDAYVSVNCNVQAISIFCDNILGSSGGLRATYCL